MKLQNRQLEMQDKIIVQVKKYLIKIGIYNV